MKKGDAMTSRNFVVTASYNVAKDKDGRHAGFSGYKPQHRVVPVKTFYVEADSATAAMDQVWAMMNRGSGREWSGMDGMGVRSMSVGDVMSVFDGSTTTRYSVEGVGFAEVDEEKVRFWAEFNTWVEAGMPMVEVAS